MATPVTSRLPRPGPLPVGEGGSGLQLLHGASLRAASAPYAKGRESIAGGRVPADDFLRAELLLVRAERP